MTVWGTGWLARRLGRRLPAHLPGCEGCASGALHRRMDVPDRWRVDGLVLPRVVFTPFWRLTRWGFLPEYLLRVNHWGDEYGRPSRDVIVPLVGGLAIFEPACPCGAPCGAPHEYYACQRTSHAQGWHVWVDDAGNAVTWPPEGEEGRAVTEGILDELVEWVAVQEAGIHRSSGTLAGEGALAAFAAVRRWIEQRP